MALFYPQNALGDEILMIENTEHHRKKICEGKKKLKILLKKNYK